MRAAILNSRGSDGLEIRHDVDVMPPEAHEVTIRIHASGVCHSDLSAIDGTLWIPVPAVMGHEGAGVVVAVGTAVDDVRVGDHVVIAVSLPCGSCRNCTDRDAPHLCGELFFDVAAKPHFVAGAEQFAAMGAIGTFADHVTVRRESVIPVPADVPFDLAALLGCGVTAGVGAVLNTARVRPSSSVVVIGAGGVGTAAVQGARLAGAVVILAVDVTEERAAAALRFGATHACTTADLTQRVKDLTGDGFDYAFECVGRGATMRAAFDAIRRGGTACIVGSGAAAEVLQLSAAEIYYNEKRVTGSYHGSADFRTDVERYLGFWRDGLLDLAGMISHRFPLEQVNDAFLLMRRGGAIRSVLEVRAGEPGG
jgi:S-(hydroxymethyl)glutathione dehydrogenase/alcohol dehydrogenase